MSKGVVLFGLNSDFKYTDLAELSAKRIKKHLGLPVTIIVNSAYKNKNKLFDKIIKIDEPLAQSRVLNDGLDKSEIIQWINFPRVRSYELSPYDETLVIDVDYLINSDHLNICFELGKDFLIYKDSCDLSNKRNLQEFKEITPYSVPFYWATVFYFKKTKYNQLFFSLLSYIKENWFYYCNLYQIKETKFRNDFAFSIAIHLLFKHQVSERFGYIPGKQFFTIDKDELIDSSGGKFKLLLTNTINNSLQPAALSGVDLHVMNKHSILRMNYE